MYEFNSKLDNEWPLESHKILKSAPVAKVYLDSVQRNKIVLEPISKERIDYFRQDEPLSQEEEKVFFAEMRNVFLDLVPSMQDSSSYQEELIKLNERYRRGMRSCIEQLKLKTETREEALLHLAIIDYISYRLRWDNRASSDVASFVSTEIPKEYSVKSTAAAAVDKLELIASLAKVNWDMALFALKFSKDSWLTQKLATRVYATRIQEGHKKEDVYDDIIKVYPSFQKPI